MPNNGDLSVWWIPQIPMKPFYVPVKNIDEAKLILNTLADYDLFQFNNRIKPDYSNTGGLEIYEYDYETSDDWHEWEDEDGYTIDEIMESEAK